MFARMIGLRLMEIFWGLSRCVGRPSDLNISKPLLSLNLPIWVSWPKPCWFLGSSFLNFPPKMKLFDGEYFKEFKDHSAAGSMGKIARQWGKYSRLLQCPARKTTWTAMWSRLPYLLVPSIHLLSKNPSWYPVHTDLGHSHIGSVPQSVKILVGENVEFHHPCIHVPIPTNCESGLAIVILLHYLRE